MEFRRIFYAGGGHDEIPSDSIDEAGNFLVFVIGTSEIFRVNQDDIVAIEDR
jgi:hypothetical protein